MKPHVPVPHPRSSGSGRLPPRLLVLAVLLAASPVLAAPTSQWVYPGSTGRLVYAPDAQGDRIMDFSNVGYQAGKAAIPDVPTIVTVSADANDSNDRARIQAAIDQVAAMPLGADGFRGAVLLETGDYEIWGQLVIQSSGVVLRGQSRWASGTVLHARGTDRRPLIRIAGTGGRQMQGPSINIVDKTVPVGMNSFRVDSTAGLAVGDTILVTRPSTAEWIHDIGMDRLEAEGRPGTVNWTPGSKNQNWERTITRIEGNRVFVDAPLSNSLEQRYGGGTLREFTTPQRVQNVGVENLRGESDAKSSTDENHSWDFVSIDKAQNVWVRETKALHFAYAHVNVGREGKWVTVQDAINHSPNSQITGGRRYTFNVNGQQVLVTGCEARDGRHDYVFGSVVPGPNVFHDSVAINAHSDTGPHHRWSTGGLLDNITTDGEINAENRWHYGTGHGWAGANMVIWNSKADGYRVQNPITAQNWVIGSKGSKRNGHFTNTLGTRQGIYDSHGTNVEPKSLYEAQVADAATLREYRWAGGDGNWADTMSWDQLAVPAVREIQFRDYLIGDVDGFAYDGNADDDYYVDPAFKAAIEAGSAHAVGGFDVLTANRNVAFTHQFQVDPGDQVVHATLALGIRPLPGTWDNDTVQIDGVGRFAFSDLGWSRATNQTTVGVLDLGPSLPVVQSGRLSVNINDDTAADFALLSLTVAREVSDAAGATVRIDNGGQVTVSTPVPGIGRLELGGSGSRLVLEDGGRLEVMHALTLGHAGAAELALDGGHLDAGNLDLGPETTLQIVLDDPAAFSAGGPPITTGDLLLDGTLQVTAPEDLVLLAGQEFVLIDYGRRGGLPESVVLPTGFDGLLFSLLLDDAAGEARLLISATATVPEPATVVLLAIGTATLLVARRRKGPVRG